MSRLQSIAGLIVLLTLAVVSGCVNKKKPAVIAATQPPVATPQPTPEPTPAPQAPPEQTQPSQGTPPPEAQPTPDDSADKTKAGKRHAAPKKAGETARNVPPKVVVRPDQAEGSPTPGQISPSLSTKEASQDQTTTEQLLQRTENNLNGIRRQLSPDEQATAAQIRDFMKQSREATKQNDLVRARNLAVKAQLLCDELIKQR